MAMQEEMIRSGNWLFRHRSYIPLFIYGLAALAIFLDPSDLFDPHALWWQLACLLVSVSGLVVRALTIGHTPKGTSGRNTKAGQVAEKLNTTGIYSVVRHPLYLGNFLMWLGLIIYTGTPWFIVAAVAFYWIYYERIMLAEESFIRRKFHDGYEEWASRTPAFFPAMRKWQKAALPFSLRNVLKREYNGFFLTFFSFALINVMKHLAASSRLHIDDFWLWSLAAAFVLALVLRTLKKKTALLSVEGR